MWAFSRIRNRCSIQNVFCASACKKTAQIPAVACGKFRWINNELCTTGIARNTNHVKTADEQA